MIRVQPARSRIRKEETPDKLTLTVLPRGLWSTGGFVIGLNLVFTGLCAWGMGVALTRDNAELGVFVGILQALVLSFMVRGLSMCVRSRQLERTAGHVTYRTWGLFGGALRRWAADDVSTLWTRQVSGIEFALVVGFRNGRSEDIPIDLSEEDVRWAATMLSDPRGERRSSAPSPLQTPEPARIRTDEGNVPESLGVRKFTNGVELSFLPLIHSRGRWWKLPGQAVLLLMALLVVASVLLRLTHGGYPAWITRIAVAGLFAGLVSKFWILNRTARIQIADRVVTILQNHGRAGVQMPVEEIEFIQTFSAPGRTELQFLRRGRSKLRILEGRPAEELEWAARFLRVALKGRPAMASTAMKVDAAAGDCQVCSEKMESRVVYCATCRTPHHEECWAYVGMCSTYACREIRFTRA